MSSRAGSAVGAVLDTKNKVGDKATAVKENIKDMPTQTAYALHSAKERQRKMCPTSSVALFRDRKPDRASVPTSSNSIDRILLISVWNFKRHRKQSRLAKRRTDQRQRELPVPMIDLSPLLRQIQGKCRKSSVLSLPTRYIPRRPLHSLSRSVRWLQNLMNLYHQKHGTRLNGRGAEPTRTEPEKRPKQLKK